MCHSQISALHPSVAWDKNFVKPLTSFSVIIFFRLVEQISVGNWETSAVMSSLEDRNLEGPGSIASPWLELLLSTIYYL